MEACKICNNAFNAGKDGLVLCEFKEGFAHLGCCTDNCSMDHHPCKHCVNLFERL
jgi:hypothetical protein